MKTLQEVVTECERISEDAVRLIDEFAIKTHVESYRKVRQMIMENGLEPHTVFQVLRRRLIERGAAPWLKDYLDEDEDGSDQTKERMN